MNEELDNFELLSKVPVSITHIKIWQNCEICVKLDRRLVKKFYTSRWSLVVHILRNHKYDSDALIQLQKLGYIPKNWTVEAH